jgi:hypothetical protein
MFMRLGTGGTDGTGSIPPPLHISSPFLHLLITKRGRGVISALCLQAFHGHGEILGEILPGGPGFPHLFFTFSAPKGVGGHFRPLFTGVSWAWCSFRCGFACAPDFRTSSAQKGVGVNGAKIRPKDLSDSRLRHKKRERVRETNDYLFFSHPFRHGIDRRAPVSHPQKERSAARPGKHRAGSIRSLMNARSTEDQAPNAIDAVQIVAFWYELVLATPAYQWSYCDHETQASQPPMLRQDSGFQTFFTRSGSVLLRGCIGCCFSPGCTPH